MGKVILFMTMSLDGFINDRNGSVDRLYPDLGALQKTEMLQEIIKTTGAVVMGRRDLCHRWYRERHCKSFDEIQIGIMPLLLVEGFRLFDHIGSGQIELERISVIESPTRTDIRFRVVK